MIIWGLINNAARAAHANKSPRGSLSLFHFGPHPTSATVDHLVSFRFRRFHFHFGDRASHRIASQAHAATLVVVLTFRLLDTIATTAAATAIEPVIHEKQQQAAGRRLFARSDQQPFQPPPKLVQWAKEAVQYYEGSTLVLSCSLATSVSPAGNPVKFAWFKQGKPLTGPAANNNNLSGRLSVEFLADYSFLRLSQLRSGDSGAYTCVASNSQGQEDRTTAQVIVNVKLRWLDTKQQRESDETSGDSKQQQQQQSTFIGGQHELVTVRGGQPVILECGAAAQPLARIRWFRLAPPPAGQRQQQQQQLLDTAGSSSHHQAPTSKQPQYRLDEAQIRSNLMQQQEGENSGFYRMELGEFSIIVYRFTTKRLNN